VIVVGTNSVVVDVETDTDVVMLRDTEVVVTSSVTVVIVGCTLMIVSIEPDAVSVMVSVVG
jgi:hypothetical protein